MDVALIILAAIVAVGALCLLYELWCRRRGIPEPGPAPQVPEECCGQHEVCERDSLLAAVSEKIEYFDDEELDAYAGRPADAYSESETEIFRDILLSLLPDDVAPWARSLQLRGIELPAPVREELLLIVGENRIAHA